MTIYFLKTRKYEVENREKEEIFTILGGKISFWKMGVGGKNNKYLNNIHP